MEEEVESEEEDKDWDVKLFKLVKVGFGPSFPGPVEGQVSGDYFQPGAAEEQRNVVQTAHPETRQEPERGRCGGLMGAHRCGQPAGGEAVAAATGLRGFSPCGESVTAPSAGAATAAKEGQGQSCAGPLRE